MKRVNKERIQSIFHLYLSSIVSFGLTAIAIMLASTNKRKALDLLLKAIRFDGYNGLAVHKLQQVKNEDLLTQLVNSDSDETTAAGRTIELSKPITNETGEITKKGVLLITFTHSFSAYLNSKLFEELNKKYLFILEPSWTGYADPDILSFCEKAEDLVIEATALEDRALINTLYPKVSTIDIGASNWVNQEKFTADDQTEKDIDILYVANNNPVKRVFKVIDTIKTMREKGFSGKSIIVCAGWGGSSDEVAQYVEKNNLSSCLEILPGVSQSDLINLYQRSKLSILFSLKEGSNRVLFESMSCNTPVFCIAENKGVNKAYINESTGTLGFDKSCAFSLMEMIKDYKNFDARNWAVKNISPEKSTSRIQFILEKKHKNINSNILIKVNNPEVEILNEKVDRFSSFEDILK